MQLPIDAHFKCSGIISEYSSFGLQHQYGSPLVGVTNIYQAVQTIVASNLIDGGNIKYFAGNSITFEPGFEVKEGTVFEAKIQIPCTNTSMQKDLPASITK